MKTAFLILAAAALAGPALAQGRQPSGPRNCVIDVDTAGRVYQSPSGSGGTYLFAGGIFKAHCRQGSTTMVSDSVEWYSERGELRLIGNVHFRDSTAILDGDRVTYWTRTERLYAEGNVYTRNLESGSEMRGPNLDYYRAVPGVRDTIELTATSRPTIYFVPQGDSAHPDTTAQPFIIVANRVRMKHTDRMWGSGNVTIDRPDLHAQSDSAMLDLADSVGYLIGVPVVVGRDTARSNVADTTATYRLTGQRIRFDLGDRQQIRHVLSSGFADARGPDWHLVGDTLDMAVDSGKIQRTQAWGSETRAVATSGLSRIVADSLDIQMPGQVMSLVKAWRDARATSKPDSTVTEDDWLSGDSLRATFAVRDSAGRKTSEIERVTAFENARAYYHTENAADSTGQRGINYSRGDRIQIAMAERRVRTVDIVGKVDGVYLEPMPSGWDTLSADSAALDSTARDSGLARPARPDSAAAGRPQPPATPTTPPGRTTPPATPAPTERPRPVRPPPGSRP